MKLLSLISTVFESRVILDGSQTSVSSRSFSAVFESRVILDGSQTTLNAANKLFGV